MSLSTSLKKIFWWQVKDVGDCYGHFGHQDSTYCHQHHFGQIFQSTCNIHTCFDILFCMIPLMTDRKLLSYQGENWK